MDLERKHIQAERGEDDSQETDACSRNAERRAITSADGERFDK